MDKLITVGNAYTSGKHKKTPKLKRTARKDKGPVGKTTVVAAKARDKNLIHAAGNGHTYTDTPQGFVYELAAPDASVFTDNAKTYRGMSFNYENVNHYVGVNVSDKAHTNEIEILWVMLKRGYHGLFPHFSHKHLHRYVKEFAAQHNMRREDTDVMKQKIFTPLIDKRLMYKKLVAD